MWKTQALRLKIRDSHLTCKVANKCLNVREPMEVVEWNENPDRKKTNFFWKVRAFNRS